MTTDKTETRKKTWTRIIAPGVEIVKHEGTPEYFTPWASVHKSCTVCGQEFIRYSTMRKEVEAKWVRCLACHLKTAFVRKLEQLPVEVAKAWSNLGGK